jgi:DNA-binding transcriptional MerR regulator
VDLARAAGVSTQQVRNLEAAGVLPDAERTASGYRRYGAAHRAALLAYGALAAGHGVPVAREILRHVNRGETELALALVDASHAALHDQRRMLEETGRALGAVAADERPVPSDGMYVGELARHLGVRPSALRVWEAAGLLAPGREKGTGYRWYTATDIRDARIIHLLRQGRYLFDRIRPVIDGLRGTGGTDALRAAIEERRAALHVRAVAMLAGASRLHEYLQLTRQQLDHANDPSTA